MSTTTPIKVRLRTYTPNPEKVCAAAAKLCYSEGFPKDSDLTPSKALPLLNKVISSGHHSILEHVSFTFDIEGISRACSHQLVRHRTGVSYSQQSQRYVALRGDPNQFNYLIPDSVASAQDCNQAHMRALHEDYCRHMKASAELYQRLMDAGIPAEDARFVLPNAAETKLVMTMNGRELLHFFSLRCCERAQWEIRALANEMLRLVRRAAPVLFSAAGPGCLHGSCPEGAMSCGRAAHVGQVYGTG